MNQWWRRKTSQAEERSSSDGDGCDAGKLPALAANAARNPVIQVSKNSHPLKECFMKVLIKQ